MGLGRIFVFIFGAFALIGCAGPSTPFGALDAWKPSQLVQKLFDSESDIDAHATRAEISVFPSRQVLHDISDIKISVYDPDGITDQHELHAYFNGFDVTKNVFKEQPYTIVPGDRKLDVQFKSLRIPAGFEKDVVFSYKRNKDSDPINFKWKSPECSSQESMDIQNISKFDPPKDWLKYIQTAANTTSINPSLIAGLVAQESSFDPNAISWAKAIGLTQITPLADEELKSYGWKRSSKISSYPSPILKTLIASGKLSSKDDYRLDPEISILAGAYYLDYLRIYWERESNKTLLANSFKNQDNALTKVLLASYNSGAYRVKKAILENGDQFLKADDLTEARKYVSKTSSYCYHFAQNEEGR